ncbi:transcriptional regulator, TetR family [Pseudonocardia thermophila]|uniref:Transcriptional regulator, TetR family n=1 Tax=Pseudonocardia thermophila TaxID=1848 RepID=A0A1M6UNU3_PSETH|nr:TetR/AcrR family transcriptional regulator [Pseudonocardia thermophila]SHK70915.1 transcriptional regulator, TetR family [Pseudonocardia thermophila]
MPYHHGDLRRALLDTALTAIEEHGPVALSLRDVARRAGVSHAAPTHHFGDKTGLLTALAAEGWTMLADALAATAQRDPRFSELGVTYVVFATSHPAHFAVMRAPGLVRSDDPELVAAQKRAADHLRSGAARHPDPRAAEDPLTAVAGWALVHGLAALIVEGSIAPEPDVETLARAVAGRLGPAPVTNR